MIKKIEPNNENNYIGPPVKKSFIDYNGFSEELATIATEQYREFYVSQYIKESIPYDGMDELLSCIKNKDYKLCIATMKTFKQVKTLLELFGKGQFFDVIETAKDEGGYSKKAMLEKIKRDFPDSEFMFVGDTNGDYNASLATGIPFVFAKYGYGEIDAYNGLSIDNLLELKRMI